MLAQPRAWLSVASHTAGSHKRLRLSAAHDEWNHLGIALAAMHEGFFAGQGLTDVELITFPESSTQELVDREAAQVNLLAEGAVDIAIDPRTTFLLEARDQRKPVCIVAARRKSHAFVVIGQKGMTSLADLRGKTVQESQAGGATDVMLRQALRDSGLEPDKDVLFNYSGGAMHDPTGIRQAFVAGSYGPSILVNTNDAPAMVQQGYPVLMDLSARYQSRHDRVTGANEGFVNEHPDLLLAFLKGMIRGCRWVLDLHNSERFRDIVLEAGFITSERERRSFDGLFAGWQHRGTRDLELPHAGIELIADESRRAGLVSSTFDVAAMLRLDALKQAQAAVPDGAPEGH